MHTKELTNGLAYLRWQLQLHDKPVNLIDTNGHCQLLLHRLLDHTLRVQHHALGGVDEDAHAVSQAHRGCHLVRKVDMTGRVEYVEQVRFFPDVLADDGDGNGLDGHATLLLREQCVGVSDRFVILNRKRLNT